MAVRSLIVHRVLVRVTLAAVTVLVASTLVGTTGAAALTPVAAEGAATDAVGYVVHARDLAELDAAVAAVGAQPTVRYERAFSGFAARLTAEQVRRLEERAGVLGVEVDRRMAVADPSGSRPPAPAADAEGGQDSPPNWGLDRIDQRALPLSGSYTAQATGDGVTIFVLDSGIDASHPEFGGRATEAANMVDDVAGDCDGHGTVVAGIAASSGHGVAPGARIRSVKVLDCSGAGTLSSLLEGVDYVARTHSGPAVAVMSWSYGASDVLEAAVGSLVADGVFVASSAGNTGRDDCSAAPRSVPGVTVVANSTIDDQRAAYSSTGSCVDLYAPGSRIVSTFPGGTTASYTGTSMSAPHVAGVAALYKQTYGDAPSSEVERWLVRNATPDVISGGAEGGTPNLLLNTGGL